MTQYGHNLKQWHLLQNSARRAINNSAPFKHLCIIERKIKQKFGYNTHINSSIYKYIKPTGELTVYLDYRKHNLDDARELLLFFKNEMQDATDWQLQDSNRSHTSCILGYFDIYFEISYTNCPIEYEYKKVSKSKCPDFFIIAESLDAK